MKTGRPFSPLAVFVGVAIDITGTMIVALVGAFVLGVVWGAQGVKPADVATKLEALTEDTTFLAVSSGVGLGFTLLGAYVAGRMADRNPVLHGTGVALAGDLFALVVTLAFWQQMAPGPAWYVVASYLAPIPVGAFGGYVASFHRKPSGPADDGEDDEYPSGHFD